MATPGRRADPALTETLFEHPYRFDFFQAVRLLARIDPDRVPVGLDGPPSREAARFHARPGLGFPASEIHEIRREGQGGDDPGPGPPPPDVTVSFLGLTGPMGVLPHAYTELLQARRKAGDPTLAAFLDLFHHRLVSLFYRAWEKHHFVVPFERGEPDPLTDALFDMVGLGGPALRDRHAFPDAVALANAPSLTRRHRTAADLEAMLCDYFGVPIAVEQFIGRWLELDPADRSTLSASGGNNQLGVSFVLGARAWDEQSKIRLRIGPLTFDQFRAFLPDGPAARPLGQLARLFVDAPLAIEIVPVLKASEIPPPQLSPSGPGVRLGRHAWLAAKPLPRDADDLAYPAPDAPAS
ncbi:type VI secretion system baseplate subunit TssG [Tundrisphaera sp. TA3]|uniref:type VI secretion system baseplate subunit TssG n=1 Tax=Tundrisphaera sp. TA3 TaxID=3435775 RepID=UPI003EBB94B3